MAKVEICKEMDGIEKERAVASDAAKVAINGLLFFGEWYAELNVLCIYCFSTYSYFSFFDGFFWRA